MDAIEKERLAEQARLDEAMGPERRNRNGQYATPGALAEEMVRFCWEHWQREPRPVRFLEPALGTGSIFSALVRTFPAELLESATGIEIDRNHSAIAHRLWAHHGLAARCADFTGLPPSTKFNLLITNPPYVRHHHLDPAQKEHLQALVKERLGIRVNGLAGLYCYFLLLADAWLEDGALAVWLIPSEFMDVNYGTAVKEYLTRRVRLRRVHRFCPTDVQFADALVSSAVVVFEKSPPGQHDVTFSLGGSIRSPQTCVTLGLADIDPAEKWTQYTARVAAGVAESGEKVLFGDLFTIRRGLATGNNDFFILTRSRARGLGIPEEWLRPILPAPRNLPDCVIEAEDDGHPRLDPQLVLLDCRLPEAAVRERYPGLWRYLEEGKRRKIPESYLASRRTPWYSQEDRPAPPFLCTYMGRNGRGRKPFRFLWNQSQATAHNVYLLLYPKGELKGLLKRKPGLHQKVFAALQSLDTATITGSGRVYGGGLFKMEPKELATIPAQFVLDALAADLAMKRTKQRSLFNDSWSRHGETENGLHPDT